MSIEVRQVSKRFGRTRALDNVSLTLEEGYIYGLLGNNGAGKSTLLNIMTGRLFADSGEVLLDGTPTTDHDGNLRQMFLAGDQNLYPEGMRVGKAFEAARHFYPGFDLEYAKTLSAKFGLDTRKKITALSTGYRSIFRLIVALSVNTPYLLLDEPVLGLDASHRDLFYRELLAKYSEKPCTILISTHLIAEVENLIERVIILRSGKLIRQMSREEFLEDGFTLSGPARLVDEYLAGRKVLSSRTLGGLKTVCVQGRLPKEDLPAGLEAGGLSMQDYFVSLMNEEEEA
jgi:ABC-2 type transport system ATP-binding protein